MSQEQPKSNGWRFPVGCIIALATVLFTPFLMMGAAFSGTPFIVLPAIILPFLYCFGGRKTYIAAVVLQMVGSALLMGGAYMFIVLCAGVVPSLIIARGIGMHRSFGDQLRGGIAVTAAGSILSALLTSVLIGGNIVDWLYSLLSQSLNTLPQAYLDMIAKSFESINGLKLSADQVTSLMNSAMTLILPDSKMRFPAALIGGAVLSGLLGVTFGNRYLYRRKLIPDTCYLPLREWALPGSVTGGLLLMIAVSFVLYNFDVKNSQAVLMVVLTLSEYAFCAQAFGSIARRAFAGTNRRGLRIFLYVALILAILLGGAFYVSIYGCASAIFGSRGFMAQKVMERMKNNPGDDKNDTDDKNDHDESNQGGN